MQGDAYPGQERAADFSTMMVGIFDDDIIEVPILHRSYHTARMIDPDHALHNARVTRIACTPSSPPAGRDFLLDEECGGVTVRDKGPYEKAPSALAHRRLVSFFRLQR